MNFLERNHSLLVKTVVADLYDTVQTTTPIAMTNYEHALFELIHGVGTTGTAVVTVEACDDASGNNPVAIPFRYRRQASADSADTWGAPLSATASGFTITAGSHQIYAVELDARELLAAAQNKPFVRLKFTEVVNSPVTGCVIATLSGGTYQQTVPISALTV